MCAVHAHVYNVLTGPLIFTCMFMYACAYVYVCVR